MTPDKNVYDCDVYPRRVIRFVDQLAGNLLAKLDKDANVLTIDRAKFEWLNKHQREQLYVARGDITLESNA